MVIQINSDQFLINKQESAGLKHLNDFKVFVVNSNEMGDTYNNIDEHDPDKKQNILIKFDDMIADMLSNKKSNPVVTELFIRGRKLNISLVFLQNLIMLYQIALRFNKLHLISYQILTLKTL